MTEGESESGWVSILLRSGEVSVLRNGVLTIGPHQIALPQIISAGLVADTSVAVPPGMPPTPAVLLRLRDGAIVGVTPVEPLDCWRLLQALATARPELATPLPSPPGAAIPPNYGTSPGYAPPSGYRPGYGPGFGPKPGYGPSYGPGAAGGPPEGERTLAGVCHLSVFFAPLILPLVIWLAMGRSQPYASRQARQAFCFHVGFAALVGLAAIALQIYYVSNVINLAGQAQPTPPTSIDFSFVPILLAGYGALAVFGLINVVFSVIAAVQAFQGKPYHYPLLGWLAS